MRRVAGALASGGAAGLSTVVSSRSRGAGSAAGAGGAHALPMVPVAASRRGGANDDSCGSGRTTGGGGGGVAATLSGVGGLVGRGGAIIEESENEASVMPVSRCRARLNRGSTTPKITAAAMATAGTPRMTRSSVVPKGLCVGRSLLGLNVNPLRVRQYQDSCAMTARQRAVSHATSSSEEVRAPGNCDCHKWGLGSAALVRACSSGG